MNVNNIDALGTAVHNKELLEEELYDTAFEIMAYCASPCTALEDNDLPRNQSYWEELILIEREKLELMSTVTEKFNSMVADQKAYHREILQIMRNNNNNNNN